jgi:hypothetical protein
MSWVVIQIKNKMETMRNTFVPKAEGLNNEQQQKTHISLFLASPLQMEIC